MQNPVDHAYAKITMLVLVLVAWLAPAAVANDGGVAAAGAGAGVYKPQPRPFTVETSGEIILRDTRRNKLLPVYATWPKGDGPFPVIVYSHGAFGSGDMVMGGLPAYWSSYGYVCLMPTHGDSMKQLRARGLDRRQALAAVRPSPETGWSPIWSERPADMTFLLDALDQLEEKLPALQGKMDRSCIGAGGHSLGAYTAQLVGGATVDTPGGKAQSFTDKRVSAILLLSGQGSGQQGLAGDSWNSFLKPLMTMTGSQDRGAQRQGPEWKREPFERSPAANKYHVFIEGAHHGSFNGRMRSAAQQLIFGYVQMATLAFWDAHLKDDTAGKDWLRSGALNEDSKGAVTVFWKDADGEIVSANMGPARDLAEPVDSQDDVPDSVSSTVPPQAGQARVGSDDSPRRFPRRRQLPETGTVFATGVDEVRGIYVRFQQLDPVSKTEDLTYAKVYAPAAADGKLPVIVVVPGGGGSADAFRWAGQNLARAGYLVFCVQVVPHNGEGENPMFPDPNAWSFVAAASGAMDGAADENRNPWHRLADMSRLGVTGFSQGSRAMSHAVAYDKRIRAAVIYDNFQVSIRGDNGSATIGRYPTPPEADWIKPRIPVLGIASDQGNFADPDVKKTAFNHYRANGIDTMLLVMEGWRHMRDFTEGRQGLAEANKRFLSHYTIAWFDHYLKGIDRREALLTRKPPGAGDGDLADMLDQRYRSGVFLKGIIDTGDWRQHLNEPQAAVPEDTAPRFWWAQAITGPADAATTAGRGRGIMQLPRIARGVSADGNGGVFIAGSFEQRCTLGDMMLESAGAADVLLGRMGPEGNPRWFKSFGASGGDYAFDVATDSEGDVLVTGMCAAKTHFDDIVPRIAGRSDAFTAKFTKAGKVLWVQTVGGAALDGGNEICADAKNNALVIGNTYGSITVGAKEFRHRGGMDAFVLKYAADGTLLWARQLAGTGNEQGRGLAAAPDGSVLVTGEFSGSMGLGETTLESVGDARDIFVGKFSATGEPVWARRFGSTGEDYGRGIGADARGNIYLSGVFSGKVNFEGQLLDSGQGKGIFFIKLDPLGRVQWARSMSGAAWAEGAEIEVDNQGRSFVSGTFVGTLGIGARKIGVPGKAGMFVASFGADGELLWLKEPRGNARSANYAIALDNQDRLTVVGSFAGQLDFDGHLLESGADEACFISQLELGHRRSLRGTPSSPSSNSAVRSGD